MSLAQLLEIEKDVTPGPWKIEPILDWSGRFAINKDHAMISTVNNEANAAFIAAARNAIPEIKAMVEAIGKLEMRFQDILISCSVAEEIDHAAVEDIRTLAEEGRKICATIGAKP